MYRYLFGPVLSRRLGVSLGVDLVVHKTCTLDCIYCECGPTTDLTVERGEIVPMEAVLAELADYFSHHPDPDYITFSGSGEPCLHSGIGRVIGFIKEKKPDVRVAVLTNGTLLGRSDVRKDLLGADLVIPSLDAVSEPVFKAVNRPEPSIRMEAYIDGIVRFRQEYQGRLALEILILKGVNDSLEELNLLKQAIEKIKPDVVQLNTLDRPGAEPGLEPADHEFLSGIARLFGPRPVEIIASGPAARATSGQGRDLADVILETLSRRPCTLEDLEGMTGCPTGEILGMINRLEKKRMILAETQSRGAFYHLRNPEAASGGDRDDS